jgi:hypothetical protein
MHGKDLCHVRCYMGHAFVAMHPMLTGLQYGPAEWIILQMTRKRKLTNCLSYLEHWINFHIIYYPLYMLKMLVYHDSSHMRDIGHMPNSGRKI